MGLPDSHGVSRDPRYLGTYPRRIASFRLQDYHLLWFVISRHIQLGNDFLTSRKVHTLLRTCPTTPQAQRIWPLTYLWFRLFRFRSPLLTESLIALCSSRYLDVSIPWVGFADLCIQPTITGVIPAGLPHSEIHG